MSKSLLQKIEEQLRARDDSDGDDPPSLEHKIRQIIMEVERPSGASSRHGHVVVVKKTKRGKDSQRSSSPEANELELDIIKTMEQTHKGVKVLSRELEEEKRSTRILRIAAEKLDNDNGEQQEKLKQQEEKIAELEQKIRKLTDDYEAKCIESQELKTKYESENDRLREAADLQDRRIVAQDEKIKALQDSNTDKDVKIRELEEMLMAKMTKLEERMDHMEEQTPKA